MSHDSIDSKLQADQETNKGIKITLPCVRLYQCKLQQDLQVNKMIKMVLPFVVTHSVKKVPGNDHSKSPHKEIVKNLFDAKLAPLSSILTWSSSAICHLVCSVFDVVSLSKVCFAIFTMDKKIEQRICFKFCIANGISCAESLKMLQKAYESNSSKTSVYE